MISKASRKATGALVVLLSLSLVSATGPGESPEAETGESPDAAEAVGIALAYARDRSATPGDARGLLVTDAYRSAHTGVHHVYLQQAHRGLEVVGARMTVNVAPDGSVIHAGSRFLSGIGEAASGRVEIGPRGAVRAATRDLDLEQTSALRLLRPPAGAARRALVSSGGMSLSPIPVKLVYQPAAEGEIRLAWNVEIEEASQEHWWNASVDAETGELLAAVDYTDRDDLLATAAALGRPGDAGGSPDREPLLPTTRSASPAGDGVSYRVIELPLETPNDGERTLVADPADATASPFGWHDTDGAPGAEFTVTRGNNVHAYTDQDHNGAPDPGGEPDGGPHLVFDYPIDFLDHPHEYSDAAVTNLFYLNNVIHDLFYGYGFDEPSGNFQVDSYERGGAGGDDVRAEAQDGGGTHNANFATPPDGSRPRMQMYLWTYARPNTVTIDEPSSAAGAHEASRATFGPQLDFDGIAGDVVLADDGVLTTSDACEPLIEFPDGAIALVDHGLCPYHLQVLNAQLAGASAVIVDVGLSGNPPTLGGSNPLVTIPTVGVSQGVGSTLKQGLPATGRVHRDPARGVTRDGDLDSGIVIHEYGHGISNRLTGGPSTTACLSNSEQPGEGWSDWLALAALAFPTESGEQPRGIGTYPLYQDEGRTARGIRPTAYSTDMEVNPTTYDDIKSLPVPHGVGYVWANMLWEVFWDLVDEYGFNPDIYGDWTTGGNNLAIQLVVDGMKFQPCRPGFVDARDGILAADEALTGGMNQCVIWGAFARRGLGAGADQGSSGNRGDGTEAFGVPEECVFEFEGFFGPLEGPGPVDVEAGAVLPAVFGLGGDMGPFILRNGFPQSRPVDCSSGESIGPATSTSASEEGLTYDAGTDRYTYPWATETDWAGTCRKLIVTFKDRSEQTATVRFG